MDQCSELCSSSWAVLHGKDFNVGHCMQTFQPNFFIPIMFIGTTFTDIDLDLNWGSQGQLRMKVDMVLKQFKLSILKLLLSEI